MIAVNWRTITDWAKRQPLTLRLADRLGRSRGRLRFLDRYRAPPPCTVRPNLARWHDHDLAAVWIGHATVLLRFGGLTVLTDPVFSDVIGVGMGLFTGGPRRFVSPALGLGELPPIDLVLVSHAHFDHLDRPTLNRLPRSTPIITARHTMDLVSDLGFRRVTELGWGEAIHHQGLGITARKVEHWGARTFHDRHRGFNAYLLEARGRRVLYGGDSAYHEHYRDLGKVDLAIMGIGAYNPYIQAHATPEQVVTMADHCRAERILAMHHGTFRLSYEPMAEPLERIRAAVRDPHRLVASEIGHQWVRN